MSLLPEIPERPEISSAAAFLLQAHQGDLRAVFFGSSRLASAILPEAWAQQTALAPNQVANLAVSSGSLWDALYMVRSAGGLPPSVDLVVIEVSDWEFNRNRRNPIWGGREVAAPQLSQWGTLSDRLAVDDIAARAGLLADLIWPLSRRHTLEQWFGPRIAPLPVPPAAPLHYTDRQKETKMAKAGVFQAKNIASKHFADPEVSSFTRRNLKELMTAVDTVPGREIILLQLPARGAYLRTLEDDPQGRAFYEEVQRTIDSYANDHVHVIILEKSEDCGLGDDVFVDYGHFSLVGAQKFTNRLYVELLRDRRLMRTNRTWPYGRYGLPLWASPRYPFQGGNRTPDILAPSYSFSSRLFPVSTWRNSGRKDLNAST